MRQQDRNQETSTDAEDSIWTVLPVALIVVLVVGIVTMGVMRSFSFGPSVGDVIVFQPSATAGDGMQRSDISAVVAGRGGSPTCILSPGTMATEGGSLVVERSMSGGHDMMQVHWAGHRTSKGDRDCGTSADLLIAPNDLLDLAGAAGGFGIGHKMMVSSTTFGTVPTMLE